MKPPTQPLQKHKHKYIPSKYKLPDLAARQQIVSWYNSLLDLNDKRFWLAATFMLLFALRRKDISSLRWRNLVPGNGTPHLSFESSHHSHSRFSWPIHDDTWKTLCRIMDMHSPKPSADDPIVPNALEEVLPELNKMLQEAVTPFSYCRDALSELRNLRIYHEYHRNFRPEHTSAFAGETINYVLQHFAAESIDTSTPVKAEES